MNQSASRCGNVVCQVLTKNKGNRGTGCLIGSVLLLTNHHVLPGIETARDGFACFFKVVSQGQSSHQEENHIRTIKVPLDPDRFFFTSPNRIIGGKPQPASEGYLDFTVVALKPAPYLSKVRNSVLSVFDVPLPTVFTPICVIQYPDEMKADDVLKGDLRRSYGQIRDIVGCSITYNAPTAGGSSGGAVIDSQGRLIALHHQMKSIPTQDPSVMVYDHVGVSIQKIAAVLQGHRAAMDKIIKETDLPPDLSQGTLIGLPATTNLFTGREKELTDLEQACSGEGKRVAVVGLGGIGKTALAVKYANDHQNAYSLICFIQSGTTSQIENGLLNLADVLEIREENPERKLLALKTKLERSQDRLLLIFDGVDDEETLTYVCEQLPQRGCTTLIVSSRLRGSGTSSDFSQLSLTGFTKEEAVAFLLKGVGEKDSDAEQAAILAEELSYLPLALTHAVAFIKFTKGYTFRKYVEGLKRKGMTLLGECYVPRLGTREETILTTWKKSMDTILQGPQGTLAADLLHFFPSLQRLPSPWKFWIS